ncbi:MAG TPA: kynureninase [Steroidobacteraceae bacterium]|nr:kynureninase [Steroidobacteraceae bacterium]
MSGAAGAASGRERALALDAADELRALRTRFALPRAANGDELTYLCGHSLGLAPLAARARVLEELEDWERLGVLGHEHGRRAWIGYAERFVRPLAELAGAGSGEVVAMNSLTVNLHLLLASFYRPDRSRYRILIEAGAFPSDRHAVHSQIRWHGLDPADALVELAPRPGEELLRQEDIEAGIAAAGDSLALVLWPGVQYRTGQAFDIARITDCVHHYGGTAGFDLAHSIGNLPLALHDSGADFAAWCSYKYLNGGPGAIGGAFVHARHAHATGLPRLEGWWGNDAATRFRMDSTFQPTPGAAGWQLSNPPVLSAAPLLASLELFAEAGLPRLRAKSRALTAFLEDALRTTCGAEVGIITPADPEQRGAQLSVRVRGGGARARRVHAALGQRGVVTDWREPDTIRLAPVPLYNSFLDAWRAVEELAAAIRASGPAAP